MIFRTSLVLIVTLLACKQKNIEPVSIQIAELSTVTKTSSDRHLKYAAGTKYDTQGFWEYLPKGYSANDQYPLLIFLHGLGENGVGDDESLDQLLLHGPPKHIAKNEWPLHDGDDFIVLSVQNPRVRCHEAADINSFLNWAITNYAVDENRVYLTGLSCGGIGIWDYLANHITDNKLAAVVPICGDGKEAIKTAGCKLAKLPTWAFHGDADKVVGVDGTTKVIDFLLNCSDHTENIKQTIYPAVNHNSWTQTYDKSEHDIYKWLLAHKRG